MPTLTFRHGVLAGLVAAALVWTSTTWAQSQSDEALRRAEQMLGIPPGGKVYSGADIGFQLKGFGRDTPMMMPVVRINGEWVEVQLGMPGIRRLTK